MPKHHINLKPIAMSNVQLRFTGDYSLAASVTLAASAAFVDGLRNGADGEKDVLGLAFPLEGSWCWVPLPPRGN